MVDYCVTYQCSRLMKYLIQSCTSYLLGELASIVSGTIQVIDGGLL